MKKIFLLSIAAGLCASVAAQVTNPKISQLPAASSVSGTEQAAINQGGATKRATLQQVANLAPNNYTTGVSFNTGSGLLSIARNAISGLTLNLDGRYVRYVDTAAQLSGYLRSGLAAVTYVPATRTITINGVTHDLSANASFTISTGSFDTTGMGLASRFWVASNYAPLSHLHSAADITSGILSVARGGTGTATPGIVAGSGITVSGSWPNQTITFSGAAGGGMDIGGAITSATAGNILFAGLGGKLSQDVAKLVYDSANHRVGINIGSPSSALDVGGIISLTGSGGTSKIYQPGGGYGMILDFTGGGNSLLIPYSNGAWELINNGITTGSSFRANSYIAGTPLVAGSNLPVHGGFNLDVIGDQNITGVIHWENASAASAPSSGCTTYCSGGHYYIICQGESSPTMLH